MHKWQDERISVDQMNACVNALEGMNPEAVTDLVRIARYIYDNEHGLSNEAHNALEQIFDYLEIKDE